MKKKAIVRLSGGLGNQIFQYAFALHLRDREPTCEVFLDNTFFLRNRDRKYSLSQYKLSIPICSFIEGFRIQLIDIICHKFRIGASEFFVYEKESHGYEKFDILKQDTYFIGYWQNLKYISPILPQLRTQIQYDILKDAECYRKLADTIHSSESIAVHVRRGDYLVNSEYNLISAEYYKQAISYIQESINNPLFCFFSDDVLWTKDLIDSLAINRTRCIFVSGDYHSSCIQDLELMRRCKHHIIANSTFSWWAAMLAVGGGTRIAPAKWFTNERNEMVNKALLDETWIKI